MNLFELDRLRQEGKAVTLPGNRSALDVVTGMDFDQADRNIDAFYARKREEERQEMLELQDKHGLLPTMLLGC